MKSDIKIYQNYIVEEDIKEFDPAFIPNDWRHNPSPELREIAIFFDFFDQQRYLEAEYVGVVSKKFSSKTNISGKQFIEFIRNNPGYDVYFINPFPHNAYFSFNVWHHGEHYHKGIISATQNLFDFANIPFCVNEMGRNNHTTLLYSNYWVGNAVFWEKYISFLQRLFKCIMQEMPETKRQIYFKDTKHAGGKVPMFPFIFERLFSTFLLLKPDIKFLAYPHTHESIVRCCLSHIADQVYFYRILRKKINEWDRKGHDENIRTITNMMLHLFSYCE